MGRRFECGTGSCQELLRWVAVEDREGVTQASSLQWLLVGVGGAIGAVSLSGGRGAIRRRCGRSGAGAGAVAGSGLTVAAFVVAAGAVAVATVRRRSVAGWTWGWWVGGDKFVRGRCRGFLGRGGDVPGVVGHAGKGPGEMNLRGSGEAGGLHMLEQVMFRSDAVVAPETGPFCCPLLFSVAKVGGPLHVSVWELAPSCITVGLGRVNEEDAVAAQGQDRVGRCRRSRFDSVRFGVSGRVWEQDPMCLAEVLEAAFCVRAPWAAACGAGWVGVVRPEVSNAAEVQQMVARGMREMRKNMSMGWQPCTVDAVDEEDEGIVAPRAVKLVARYHLSNVTKMMVVLSKFQTVHGVTKENNIEKASEDENGENYILMAFGLVMVFLGLCQERQQLGCKEVEAGQQLDILPRVLPEVSIAKFVSPIVR
ncbi:unnamed protein product [Durusdinium trenchii]|uniref:Uncharacterized protein n=1 Tax=Durusdinium trenchii TaxID=1381693 RepID=A0ABP0IGF4_9DINO